ELKIKITTTTAMQIPYARSIYFNLKKTSNIEINKKNTADNISSANCYFIVYCLLIIINPPLKLHIYNF
ncbi:hypothetical protein ACIE8Z_15835, partial (plasmid) [Cetobacterium somerae ATCC BAA-474]|uniref:hypothetical protein n=1 Tax=Cetobacterium somerae TaxID=188913 RepID=UPI003CC5310A